MTTTRDITVITDQSTRAELVEALTWQVHRAKREVPRGAVIVTEDPPTAYDRRHATINELLTDLEHAPKPGA